MEQKRVDFIFFILFITFVLIAKVHLQSLNEKGQSRINNQRACAYVQCEKNDTCVHRKFRCKDSSCPSMLYCAKSRTELLKGPSTCNTVHCSSGYLCVLKVRRCRWDEKCKQQIARCVSRKEYHEGPASCAGFKCAQGSQCILRESFCRTPPCKLLRSCAKNKEAHVSFSKCRSLGCLSEYECFLRRPEQSCENPPCKHTPDCMAITENEVTNEHCRGWICPRFETCHAEVIGTCDADKCNVKRTCHKDYVEVSNYTSSFSKSSLSDEGEHMMPNTIDTQAFSNASQQSVNESMNLKNEIALVNKSCLFGCRMVNAVPQLWLDRLNTSSELDAIQLLLKSIEERKNVKSTLSQEHEQKGIEEIDSFLREKNLTSMIHELLIPNTILLPPYTPLEMILLNSLRESNYFPFLDTNFYKRDRILPSQLLDIKNPYEQPYHVTPLKNMETPDNLQVTNHDPSFQHNLGNQYETSSQNKIFDEPKDAFLPVVLKNFSETLKNSPITEDSLSLWAESDNNLGKDSFYREEYFSEDSNSKFENDRTQYSANLSVKLLEKLVEALLSSPIENIQQTFTKDEENHQDAKDSRISKLLYREEGGPTFQSFYSTPNYKSDDVNITARTYKHDRDRKNLIEENQSEHKEDIKYKFVFNDTK